MLVLEKLIRSTGSSRGEGNMGRIPLRMAALAFLIFITNVVLAAFGNGAILGDVAEMLTLLIAVMLFVAGILNAEASAKTKNTIKK
jgi:hypothetical protein